MVLTKSGLVTAGYWSSWNAKAREDNEVKQFLGLLPEDQCLGVYYLGRSNAVDQYRSARGALSEKIRWQ